MGTDLIWALAFLVSLLSLLGFEYWSRTRPAYRAAQHFPGECIYPVIGNFFVGRNLIDGATSFRHALEMANRYKRGYRFVLLNQLHYWPILCHELEFLFNSPKNSDKSFYYTFMLPMLGDGLLISNGAKWAHRRKILTPAFHFNILQKFLGVFQEESNAFVRNLAAESGNPKGTAIHDLISRFTLNNICETAMGVKLSSTTEPDNYRGMIYRSGEILLQRYLNPVLYNDTIFSWTGASREMQKCVRLLHDFSGTVIAQRRNAYRGGGQQKSRLQKSDHNADSENIYEKNRYAMLDTLLEAEADGEIDTAGVQEEVDTFMFEGHDTTSAALTFCLFTLGTYAEHQAKCHAEIAAICNDEYDGDCGRLGVHDYSRLTHLDLVIKETFRLFPPVPYISRQLNQPVELPGGVTLPTETQVHIFIYNVHRDPEQFPDPERFDPDRFRPELASERHPFAYIPFSAGTRNCIGQKFALLEIKCLLARLLFEYRLETLTRLEDVAFVSDLVLRTVAPIRVRFERRRRCDD